MYRGTAFLNLAIALTVAIQCLASQPDLFKHVAQDDLRSNFENLIANNPNYFGNAPESNRPAVAPLSFDTQYEQLVSIGFDSRLSVLEATIEIKLDYGFNGPLCSNGSFEYVRFYVRYGHGLNEWNNVGAAGVNTHDILDVLDCSNTSVFPLFYVLTLPFQPSAQQNCTLPLLPEIRAILSWNQLPPPSDPFFAPVWGNALDQHIQSPTPKPSPPSLYSTSRMLSANYGRKELRDSEAQLFYPQNQQPILSEDSSTPTLSTLPRPGQPKNIIFEELIGLGLDYSFERIVATIRIKRPDGYGTGICENGTLEYIAFWADWYNICNWTYLGELTVNVHNIPNISPDGVAFSATLPVDLRNVSHLCNTTQISRVRAALSWNTPPPEPPRTAARGNWLQVHVQIPPYVYFSNSTTPTITTIGGIQIQEIDTQLTGLTIKDATWPVTVLNPGNPNVPVPVDPNGFGRPCPFGGIILITGPPTGMPGQSPSGTCEAPPPASQYLYRIVYRPFGSTTEPNPLLSPISVEQSLGSLSQLVYPLNSLGYFYYISLLCNWGNLLGSWQPTIMGLYQIRLEIATETIPGQYTTEGTTDWYNIYVNFPAPTGTFIPTNEPVCGTFPSGTNLTGTMTAQDNVGQADVDQFFASYQVSVSISDVEVVIDGKTNPGYTAIDTPVSWSWNSVGVQPCGYVVQLEVCDLTVYNSMQFFTYPKCVVPAGFGFCVGPALGTGM